MTPTTGALSHDPKVGFSLGHLDFSRVKSCIAEFIYEECTGANVALPFQFGGKGLVRFLSEDPFKRNHLAGDPVGASLRT